MENPTLCSVPFRKNIQTVLSFAYIFGIGIGMLFSYKQYFHFGINIFEYADVFDFLLAPFVNLSIVLFTIFSLSISYLVVRFDIWYSLKHPQSYSKLNFGMEKKTWFNAARYIFYSLTFIVYLYAAANLYGKLSVLHIKKQAPVTLRYADNETLEGQLIGKTKDIVFLLCDDHVKAIPIASNVKELVIR